LIFNDLNTTEQIKVYDRGIHVGRHRRGSRRKHKLIIDPATFGARTSSRKEALALVVAHFARLSVIGKTP